MTKKSFLKKIYKLFKPFWKHVALLIFILTIMQGIDTLTPYLFGRGVDAVVSGNIKLTFIFLAISFGLAFLQTQPLSFIKEYIDVKKLDTNVEKSLAVYSLKTMFGFSIGQHINEHSGVKQTIVNKGMNSLYNLINNFMYNIFQIVVQIIVVMIILFFFDWRVAGVALSFVLLYLLISNRRNKRFFPKIDQIRKKNQAQGKLAAELYRNSTLVIAEGQEGKTVGDFEHEYDQVSSFTINTWFTYLKRYYLDKIVVLTGRYVTLAVGIYFILIGDHSTGMFVTFFAWTGTIFGNLTNLMNSQRQILFQVVEIKKYFELMDIEPDINPNIDA
jgi:ABC-type multidrug transport system fused ATPase/permease subunit